MITYLRFHSHMQPVTAVCPNFSWNASCANTPVMYVLGDFDSKVITKCIPAACRTPRSASVTCVNVGEDGREMRTGQALGPSGV